MKKTFLRKMIAVMFVMALFIPATTVLADQFAYISKSEAEKGAEIIKGHKQIMSFCEPCSGDTKKITDINEVEAGPAGYQDFWEVKVNGAGVDLAYVFIPEEDGRWKNVALFMDLAASDVSQFVSND